MGLLDGILDKVTSIGGGDWLTAGTSLLSGIMSSQGQEEANVANAKQAKDQMAFQERMANTGWQRAVADMSAAGLNPMLAYSQGPNATPGGSQAVMGNVKGAGVTAGIAAANSAAQVQNTAAQTRNINADTKLKEADLKDPDATRNAGGDLPTKSFPAAEKEARSRELHAAAKLAENRWHLTNAQNDLVRQEIQNAIAEGERIKATTRDTTANAVLRELAKNEGQAKSNFYLKYPGAVTADRFGEIAGKWSNSAANVSRIFKPWTPGDRTYNIHHHGE